MKTVILSVAKDPRTLQTVTKADSFLATNCMPQGFTYIMGSNTGTLYIGVTSRLPSLVLQHKKGEGSHFRSMYGCHRLPYFERFEDIRNAISREKALKGITRARELALIQKMNPEYRDLAASWGVVRIGPQQSIGPGRRMASTASRAGSAATAGVAGRKLQASPTWQTSQGSFASLRMTAPLRMTR